jgi:membrane protease YdiL (CAAX protease family)
MPGILTAMTRVLIVAVAVGLAAAVVRIWTAVFLRWWRGGPIVEREQVRDVPWGLLDLIVALAFLFLFSILALAAVQIAFGVNVDTPQETRPLAFHSWKIAAAALASLATLVSTCLWIKLRLSSSWRDLGFSCAVAGRDIRLGVMAFLAVAPPTYALQYLLVWYFQPDVQHPLIELLKEHRAPSLIVVSVFSAVLVAPLVEEFLFRGLLQGWLEKLARHAVSARTLLFGDANDSGLAAASAGAASAAAPQDAELPTANPYCSPRPYTDEQEQGESSDSYIADPVARYLPILASSLLFALMHMSHGPDWVPLFFLALALGYLYQQTHRLLPCITVHFLLNACSMTMLLLELLA